MQQIRNLVYQCAYCINVHPPALALLLNGRRHSSRILTPTLFDGVGLSENEAALTIFSVAAVVQWEEKQKPLGPLEQ